MNKRIGIFAGSFNPIHDGHIAVAESAIKNIGLDEVLIMVEKNPWSSKKPISINHRKSMVNLAIENIDNIKQLELQDDKFDLEKTLPKIEKLYPDSELYFIFGADVFLHMNTSNWPKLESLFKHNLVVFERSKITENEISEHAKNLATNVTILPSQFPHHSSTDVRFQKQSKYLWVSREVSNYIDVNNLY